MEIVTVGDLVLLAEPGTAGTEPARRVLAALAASDAVAAVTCTPVVDTLKLVDAEGVVRGTAERDAHRTLGLPAAVRASMFPPGGADLGLDAVLAGVAAGGKVLAVTAASPAERAAAPRVRDPRDR